MQSISTSSVGSQTKQPTVKQNKGAPGPQKSYMHSCLSAIEVKTAVSYVSQHQSELAWQEN